MSPTTESFRCATTELKIIRKAHASVEEVEESENTDLNSSVHKNLALEYYRLNMVLKTASDTRIQAKFNHSRSGWPIYRILERHKR